MDKKIKAAEKQLAYAKILDMGMKIGLLALIVTFIACLTGVLTPHVPVNDLPKYWSLSVHKYLEGIITPISVARMTPFSA